MTLKRRESIQFQGGSTEPSLLGEYFQSANRLLPQFTLNRRENIQFQSGSTEPSLLGEYFQRRNWMF